MSLQNVDRITKIVMRPCPQLVVKHIVKLIRRNSKDLNKKYDFAYEYNLTSFQNAKAVQFVTEDSILIESTKNTEEQNTKINGGIYKPPPQVFISYMEAPLTIMSLDIALQWLQGEENKDIFISDVHGQPIKLGKPEKTIVPMNFNKFLIMQPAIIYDQDNTAYQGIKLKCETGDIADLTAQEFYNFSIGLKYILMNLYANSNILTLMGMVYFNSK